MSKMYVKKPIPVEACQWNRNGDHPRDHDPIGIEDPTNMDMEKYSEYKNCEGKIVRYYRTPKVSGHDVCKHCNTIMHIHGWIDTLEGGHIVCPGDFIITGVQGEHYPCKPDIFEQSYDVVV